jgi:hypothetical protein
MDAFGTCTHVHLERLHQKQTQNFGTIKEAALKKEILGSIAR